VAFTVDPLFQQTSAQFDEGGAKGLLLNTLSVFQGCEIVFDSWEVPEKSMSVKANDFERHASINLSFMKGKSMIPISLHSEVAVIKQFV
jgi:condensin complex subunit 2